MASKRGIDSPPDAPGCKRARREDGATSAEAAAAPLVDSVYGIMPLECWVRVFVLLSVSDRIMLRLVCRAWAHEVVPRAVDSLVLRGGAYYPRLLPRLGSLRHLTVRLGGEPAANAALRALTDALPLLSRLQSLTISCPTVSSDVLGHLLSRLECLKRLQTLSLNSTRLRNVVTPLGDALSSCSATAVDLSGCALGHVISVCCALPAHVRSLSLARSGVMPRDVPGLEHVLQGHTALTELDLSYNLLRHEGTRLVIAALKGASALVRLNLAGNDMGEAGCQALTRAIGQWPALQSLDVSDNWLDREALVMLSSRLKLCPVLRVLNVCRNDVTLSDIGAWRATVELYA